ncbi:MAG: hypothetical protein WD182_08615 [Bacteroidota bacterium]
MSYDFWAIVVVLGVIILLLAGIVSMIREPKKGAGAASLTAFHDLQPQDKQKAMEMVMELKAGKKMEEQESGKNK